jgi:hypothetical protein
LALGLRSDKGPEEGHDLKLFMCLFFREKKAESRGKRSGRSFLADVRFE